MHGHVDPGPAGRLGVAADGVDVAPVAGALEQERPRAEHAEDDEDRPRDPLERPDGGPVDVADRHDGDSDGRHEDDLDDGEADAAAPPARCGAAACREGRGSGSAAPTMTAMTIQPTVGLTWPHMRS